MTVASTPETCSSSAGTYATNGVRTESATSSDGSVTMRRRWANTQPTASPIAMPAAATPTNSKPISKTEPADAPTAPSASR